jgi:diacylglycerol kinase family enzyme
VTVTARQRAFALLAITLAAAAAIVLIIGGLRSVGGFVVGVAGLAVCLAGAWGFVSRRGVVRWAAATIAVAAPIAVLIVYIARGVIWPAIAVLALVAAAAAAARGSLVGVGDPELMPERDMPEPEHAFLVMNPRSGGGKVGQFDLQNKALALGARVEMLDGPGHVDVAALAQQAATGGADLLGVAGGDGTQALVAGVAARHGLPFLVISAGTRNHFAMDLGLDRAHPDACLDALSDGVEICLDLGDIGGRTFVNNVSFGAYAAIVQSPAYRDDKRGTTLKLLPDLLSGHRGPRLTVRVDGDTTIEAPQAVLISNNPYVFNDVAGLGRRARLDTGVLGVVAVTVANAADAADLVRGRHARGVSRYLAHEVVVDADVDAIPVGIDGEAVMVATPVRCTIQPQALRVRVPRQRPGVHLSPAVDPRAVVHQAFAR